MPIRYPLIYNPEARSQRSKPFLHFLFRHAPHFIIYASQSAHDATELAKELSQSGHPIVIAAGGDGTINAVIKGLWTHDTSLGIFPAGTMNVFARELELPLHNFKKNFSIIQAAYTRNIDLFSINNHPFVQMAGIGFDAAVLSQTSPENKRLFGPFAYLPSALKILGTEPPLLSVQTAEGEKHEGVFLLAGNGCFYGGSFPLFKKANHCDGLLDLLLFTKASLPLLLGLLGKLAQGQPVDKLDGILYLQSANFTIQSDSPLPFEADGEFLAKDTSITLAPLPKRIQTIVAPPYPLLSSSRKRQKTLLAF